MKHYIKLLIGLYQIFCALYLAFVLSVSMVSDDSITRIQKVFFIYPILCFGIISGMYLIFSSKKRFFWLTIVNLSLQIMQFKISGLAFDYISGPYAGLGYIRNDSIIFYTHFEIFVLQCYVKINIIENNSFLMINIIPALILYFFYKFYIRNAQYKI